jgi:hypothetical protein
MEVHKRPESAATSVSRYPLLVHPLTLRCRPPCWKPHVLSTLSFCCMPIPALLQKVMLGEQRLLIDSRLAATGYPTYKRSEVNHHLDRLVRALRNQRAVTDVFTVRNARIPISKVGAENAS